MQEFIIPFLSKRGQEHSILPYFTYVALSKWTKGLTQFISDFKWEVEDYYKFSRHCIENSDIKSLKMILQQMKLNKISLDGVDDKGDSLLHDAVRFETKEIVKILLNEGSDRNLINAMGLTPKEIANQLPSQDIYDILKILRTMKEEFNFSFFTMKFKILNLN